MVSWAGLRGAVPIVLATYPLIAGVSGARTIFNLVFFVVFISVLLQGTTIPLVARWLGVAAPLTRETRLPLEFNPTVETGSQLIELSVPEGSRVAGCSLVELSLPERTLVVIIERGDEMIVPRGATVVQPHDRLLVLAPDQAIERVRALVTAPRGSATPA